MKQDWRSRLGPVAQQLFALRREHAGNLPKYTCPSACAARCCTGDILYLNVTLFDILEAAGKLGEAPAVFFANRVELGTEVVWDMQRQTPCAHLWRLQWKLRGPCSLLSVDGKCTVHDSKPLACQQFPEMAHLQAQNITGHSSDVIEDLRADPNFHCFHDGVSTEYIKQAERSVAQVAINIILENTASDLLLFHRSPMVINVAPNIAEIDQIARRERKESRGRLARYNERVKEIHGDGALSISASAVLRVVQEKIGERLRENTLRILKEAESPRALELILQQADQWITDLETCPFFTRYGEYVATILPDTRIEVTPL